MISTNSKRWGNWYEEKTRQQGKESSATGAYAGDFQQIISSRFADSNTRLRSRCENSTASMMCLHGWQPSPSNSSRGWNWSCLVSSFHVLDRAWSVEYISSRSRCFEFQLRISFEPEFFLFLPTLLSLSFLLLIFLSFTSPSLVSDSDFF